MLKTFKEELRDAALKRLADAPAPRKDQPCRIRVAGRFVQLLSGKSLWKTPGHAKAAFVNHVEETWQVDDRLREMHYHSSGHKEPKQVAHEMLSDGTVEIVPL